MSYQNLMRITGVSAILAGAVNLTFNLLSLGVPIPAMTNNARSFAMLFLIIFAYCGFYARQHHKAGVIGLAGFVLAVIGLIMNVCFRWGDLFVGSVLMTNYPEAIQAIGQGPYPAAMQVTFITFTLGYVLFGIGMLKARVFPAIAAWMIILGAILSYALVMLPVNVGAILINSAFIWMGYRLFSEQPATAMSEMQPALAAD